MCFLAGEMDVWKWLEFRRISDLEDKHSSSRVLLEIRRRREQFHESLLIETIVFVKAGLRANTFRRARCV